MDVFLITFQAVAALLGIGLVGFWIIGRRHLPANALALLTNIAIDICLPSLVLGNIITDFTPQQFPDWWHLPLWWIGFTAIALFLSYISAFSVNKENRGEFIISLLYQNGIFLPLLVIVGLFRNPEVYLVSVFLFVFLQPSLVFSTYSLFFGRKAGPQKLDWRRIVNPVLVVTVIGLVIGLAVVSAFILIVEFFWQIVVIGVLTAGLYIMWDNIREIRR